MVSFLFRGAPPRGCSARHRWSHFNPQHLLLCHMGLCQCEFEFSSNRALPGLRHVTACGLVSCFLAPKGGNFEVNLFARTGVWCLRPYCRTGVRSSLHRSRSKRTLGFRWPRGHRTSMGSILLSLSSVRTRALRLRPCGVAVLLSSSFRGRFAGTGAWCWQRCGGPGALSSLLRKRSSETGRWYLRRCSKTMALYRSLRKHSGRIGGWF